MIEAYDIVLFAVYLILLFLSIFWITVFFFVKDEKKPNGLGRVPLFSVIVPAYNEERAIADTLSSLVNLDYPKDKKEIIVVNDGSKDRTKEIVEEFISNHSSERIILINQENRGKANAMNHGLKYARGEFYACLDADSFVDRNALKNMLPYFYNEDVAAVCPLLKINNPKSFIEKVQWYEYVVNMFYKYLNAKIDCIHVTPGPFSIYRTDVVKRIGGYDEKTITEDLEIAIRLQKYQYRLIQTFDGIVYTNAPRTWKGLFRQRVRWYTGSVNDSWKHKKLIFNKKYGDFGFVRMPTIILSGLLTIIITVFLLRDLIIKGIRELMFLLAIKFDIIPLITNASLDIDFLSLPYIRYVIAITVMAIGLFMMFYSYKIVGEKITNYGRTATSLFFYLFIYSFFISIVWMYIAFAYITRRGARW